jgi:hypothetical protein
MKGVSIILHEHKESCCRDCLGDCLYLYRFVAASLHKSKRASAAFGCPSSSPFPPPATGGLLHPSSGTLTTTAPTWTAEWAA